MQTTWNAGRRAFAIAGLLLASVTAACQQLNPPATDPSPGTPAVIESAVPTNTVAPTETPVPPTATVTPIPTATPVVGAPTIGDALLPELGNTGYNVLTYTLDLAVEPALGRLDGTTTIAAISELDDLARISLDFVGFDISEVLVDGRPAAFQRLGKKLLVDVAPPVIDAGQSFTVSVSYAGEPVREDSPYIHFADYLGLTFLENQNFYVLSQPDGARYWFPANDHPSDKAAFHIALTVPTGQAAIANGRLTGTELATLPDGSSGATFFWEHNYPMAPYLALAAAGHYLRKDEVSPGGVPLVFYYFPEFEEEFLEATAITGEAIDWMSELFGPYPFESYGQATYYALGVSMESQTMTLLSFQMLNERTVIHEMAHAWFGNWVTPASWADVWRNEGFATYVELLWLDYHEPGTLQREIDAITQEAAEKGRTYPLDEPPEGRLLAWDAYNRGALLVHALRLEMGDEAFFSGLRAYFERYGGGTATQEEFQAVMEEAAGFSLDEFFAGWLE